MKLCIPTKDNHGSKARAFDHFGSAPYFTMVDVDRGRLQSVPNPESHQHHHSCHHIDLLKAHDIDAVVCPGVGRRAYTGLRHAGIEVLVSRGGTVSEIVEMFAAGGTPRMPESGACAGGRHGHGHGDRERGGHGCGHGHGAGRRDRGHA